VDDDKITQAQADKAFKEDLSPPAHMFKPTSQTIAPGFVSYVTGQLKQRFGNEATYGGGPRVDTTLNLTLQNIGQKAISGTQADVAWRRVQQGALVAIEPNSGASVAMVGAAAPNTKGGDCNTAVWPRRNPAPT